MPMITTTRLPGSSFEVILHGPSRSGEFIYTIEGDRTHYNNRNLGKIEIDPNVVASFTKEREGVYRIQWGTEANSPFVVIDVKERRIVEDNNPSNQRNAKIEVDRSNVAQ